MKILKRILYIIVIIIIVIILILVGLFFSQLETTTATITDIIKVERDTMISMTDNDVKESFYFNVNISEKEYVFYSSHILFLDNKNKKIKANELKIGDNIYILQLNFAIAPMNPQEIHNILLVKKLK